MTRRAYQEGLSVEVTTSIDSPRRLTVKAKTLLTAIVLAVVGSWWLPEDTPTERWQPRRPNDQSVREIPSGTFGQWRLVLYKHQPNKGFCPPAASWFNIRPENLAHTYTYEVQRSRRTFDTVVDVGGDGKAPEFGSLQCIRSITSDSYAHIWVTITRKSR